MLPTCYIAAHYIKYTFISLHLHETKSKSTQVVSFSMCIEIDLSFCCVDLVPQQCHFQYASNKIPRRTRMLIV